VGVSGRLAAALPTLTVVTALGCALVAGVFFAFSTFVMPALARLPAPQGIAAMQSINVAAVTPPFMLALFGTGLACLVLGGAAVADGRSPGALRVLLGCALYVAGTLVVTMAANVPLNDALARADASGAAGARLWAAYVTSWTAWNHVRTIAALAAAVLLCPFPHS
jgi:uncharacterized membrane protein